MAPKKFDGVVEAVRYAPDGQVELVRVYQRRGAAFSDRILLTRQDFLALLKGRKRYFSGQRVQYMAGTFALGEQIKAQGKSGQETLVTGSAAKNATGDLLAGVPLF